MTVESRAARRWVRRVSWKRDAVSQIRQIFMVGVVLAGGVLAASDLGAVAPVTSILEQNLGIPGRAIGWATSIITALAAGAGLPVAQVTRHHDPARLFAHGLGLLAVAGVATGALAAGPWSLIGLRALSGVGYLLIVITGPAVLVRLTTPGARSAALGLWGLCMPGGLAVATATGGLLAGPLGWQVWPLRGYVPGCSW